MTANPYQNTSEPTPTRTVHTADALTWLAQNTCQPGASIITSLPDFSEIQGLSLAEWKSWFKKAAALCLRSVPDTGVVIFFQTDIKVEGTWVDKGLLCQLAALETGHELIWHKIVCKVAPGHATYARPGYSRMLCFSKGIRADLQKSSPDVLPLTGDTTWARGMGVEACKAACRFVLDHTEHRTILDPFCGHGTVLAVANSLGLDSIGVELGGNRADKARRILLNENGSLEFAPRTPAAQQ
jgi:hypothetical protein